MFTCSTRYNEMKKQQVWSAAPQQLCVSTSHRTMLFLWCNWSIRQNKRRACCSACASSIIHKRCTENRWLNMTHANQRCCLSFNTTQQEVIMWPLQFQNRFIFGINVHPDLITGGQSWGCQFTNGMNAITSNDERNKRFCKHSGSYLRRLSGLSPRAKKKHMLAMVPYICNISHIYYC